MKKLLFILLAFAFTFSITSCSKDEPKEPDDETEHLGHDQWHKVVFDLYEGHLHGVNFHGNPTYPDSPLKRIQTKTFSLKADGTISVDSKNPFYVVSGRYYALEIKYYDADGDLMNSEFATAEMAPIHQHFFTASSATYYKENKTTEETTGIYDYTYRDTDPVDVQINQFIPNTTRKAKLRSNDPLGFKGYFYIEQPYVEWDMRVRLVHVINGTKFDKSGQPYPFNNPAPYLLSTTDLNLDLPFKSITTTPDSDTWDVYVNDIAEEFGKTATEISKAETNGGGAEDSQYWM